MWCWRSSATSQFDGRADQPHRESQILAPGDALAEFCNDDVTAWSAGAFHAPLVQRTAALPNNSGADRNWNWSPRMGPPIPSYWTGFASRLLDAGAAPAGHGSKLARVLRCDLSR